jgi:hypothetical protein
MGEESRGETYGVFASYKTVSVSALENKGQADFEYIAMDPNTKQTTKSQIQTTNHETTEVHFRNQKSDGSTIKLNPNVTIGPPHKKKKNPMDQTYDTIQTQVFFPGSDYLSYKAIGGKSQILTARILRRQKSRRRIGKP